MVNAVTKPTHDNDTVQPNGEPPAATVGLIVVRVTLELSDMPPSGAPSIVYGCIGKDDRREIRIKLSGNHLLVSKALLRADTLTIKFLIGLALSEFRAIWNKKDDGRATYLALRELAGCGPSLRLSSSALASRLGISEPMRSVDTTPIFGRNPSLDRHELFVFKGAFRSPSDVSKWRPRGPEDIQPLTPKPLLEPTSEPSGPPQPTAEQRFHSAFYAIAREMLDGPTVEVLEQFTRERMEVANVR
jgi:hypothetical protein